MYLKFCQPYILLGLTQEKNQIPYSFLKSIHISALFVHSVNIDLTLNCYQLTKQLENGKTKTLIYCPYNGLYE